MADLRDVYIIGVGQHPCGKFPTKAAHVLGREAAWAAIKDSGIYARDIEMGFCGHVYQGMGVGQRTLKDIGLVGQPVINIEGACGSGTLAFWEAWRTIAYGQSDIILAWGVENLSKVLFDTNLQMEFQLAPISSIVLVPMGTVAILIRLSSYRPRGWASSYCSRRWSLVRWVYICVLAMLAWPKNSWT